MYFTFICYYFLLVFCAYVLIFSNKHITNVVMMMMTMYNKMINVINADVPNC